VLDLLELLDSWEIRLRAERKSRETIKSYTTGVRQFVPWCTARGMAPVLDADTVAQFIDHLLDEGREPATARARWLSLRRFSGWLAEEGEIPEDRLINMKPPKLDQKVMEPLSEDELRALIKACHGPGLRDRRDEAMVRLLAETGARISEILGLTTHDIDVKHSTFVVRRGKGGKGRPSSFGPDTAAAVDRYVRARRQHRLANTNTFWLGERGKRLAYFGAWASR
jgi:site-specific recombinase XerD